LLRLCDYNYIADEKQAAELLASDFEGKSNGLLRAATA
jgi:hypothetical protein